MNSSNLIGQSFKLVPRPLVECPRPKSDKLRAKPTWHLFWRVNQLVRIKNSAKRRDSDLENQELGEGPRYSPTQGLNLLLQISPNWFLGNWTLDPHLTWA
jgi:hypothetical protein